MLEKLDASPPETIMQIAADFAADPRQNKIDLGIGVYKNEAGTTPVPESVKQAERLLGERQRSKAYVGLLGNVSFNQAVSELILGPNPQTERLAAMQTPGGSGALRLLYELVGLANPDATIWLPDPSWLNHLPTIHRVGLQVRHYPYFDSADGTVNFAAMRAALAQRSGNDVVLLHGCCHNPTGASLSPEQWDEIAALSQQQGFIPLVDLAYQGFGEGLAADAYGVRQLCAQLPEVLIAYSCSKNFAIYRERTGLALVMAKNTENTGRTLGQMKRIARASHSMPPDHGAAIVQTILQDAALRPAWEQEVTVMRERMATLRQQLAAALREHSGTRQYDYLATQQGMFSRLNLSPQQVQQLRDTQAIYMVADGRMNLAGLNQGNLRHFVKAVAAVSKPVVMN